MLEKESTSQKASFIGKIFFIGIFCLFLFLIVQADCGLRTEIRGWIQVVVSASIPFAIFYFSQQANQRSQVTLKEKQEQEELQKYIDRISHLVVKENLNQSTELDPVFHIARTLTENVFRELSPERINKVIEFLRSLNLTGSEKVIKDRDRSISIFQGINLSGTNLQDINASSIDFSKANFEKANLSGSILKNAILTGSNLKSCILIGVILDYAKIQNACLDYTNLSRSHLFGTDFSNSHFSHSNLTASILINTDFSYADIDNSDFSQAESIEYAKFEGTKLLQSKLDSSLTQKQQKQFDHYDPILSESISD